MRRDTLRNLIEQKRRAYDEKEEQSQPAAEDETVTHQGAKKKKKVKRRDYAQEAMEYVGSDHRTGVIASGDLRRIAGQPDPTPQPPIAYQALPQGCTTELHRIILTGANAAGLNLGISLGDDVIIGHSRSSESPVDLDLALHISNKYGISRRHALLRSSSNKLFLIDLDSTNGTMVNGARVYPSRAMQLSDGDTITLGKLNMTISIE
jgi:hypothetical protein